MEPQPPPQLHNETQLNPSSYFLHQPTAANTAAPTPPTNGTHMMYTHSVPSSAVVSSQTVKRKRGRPRKYSSPALALAAKKAASASARAVTGSAAAGGVHGVIGSSSSPGSSARKAQLVALSNAGQSFTPHVITVAQGEDVGQKIMMFMQHSKREICILSASGAISDASLRQPATSGGSMTYEGRYDIISLSGSYVRTEMGGRTGGLSICLSSTNGQLIGGSVGGPLKAAGSVQVVVGTFVADNKKDVNTGSKGGASVSTPVGVSISGMGFRLPVESSGLDQVRINDDHQTIGGNHFMGGIHVTQSRPTEWSGHDARSNSSFDMTGTRGHGAHQSPENGDYGRIAD